MASKQKSNKQQKVGRQKRSPSGKTQFLRTYRNKLKRVNRARSRAGKEPLVFLAGYNIATGVPDYKVNQKPVFAPLNPKAARW